MIVSRFKRYHMMGPKLYVTWELTITHLFFLPVCCTPKGTSNLITITTNTPQNYCMEPMHFRIQSTTRIGNKSVFVLVLQRASLSFLTEQFLQQTNLIVVWWRKTKRFPRSQYPFTDHTNKQIIFTLECDLPRTPFFWELWFTGNGGKETTTRPLLVRKHRMRFSKVSPAFIAWTNGWL